MPDKNKVKGNTRTGRRRKSVSRVREKDPNQVIAILLSDIHLSDRPPVARSSEPDWFEAMLRPIKEVRDLWHRLKRPPIICAGDIFDRWNPSPKLINFALQELPQMYAVAGQHDLRHHNYADIRETAFWTLVEANKITHLDYKTRTSEMTEWGNLELYGFNWGQEIIACPKYRDTFKTFKDKDNTIDIAVVHQYIWANEKTSYPNAPERSYYHNVLNKAKGYHTMITGDNHKHFYRVPASITVPQLFNCGGFMRRKIDEFNYSPTIGFLLADRSISTYGLDCSQDKFIDVNDKEQFKGLLNNEEAEEFMSELAKLGAASLDFHEAVMRFLQDPDNKTTARAKRIILEAMSEETKP